MVTAYCFKEKKKNVEIVNPVYALNSIGRRIARGTCKSCGGKVQALLKAGEGPASLVAKSMPRGASKKSKKSKKGGASRSSRKSKDSRKSKGSRKSKRSRTSRK